MNHLSQSYRNTVAVLQFDADNHPCHVTAFLDERAQPYRLLRLDLDPRLPDDDFAGFVLMGGPMMVGDDLPWMQPVLARLRDCLARDVPVFGHCLGAQLLAVAAGAEVGPCAHHEIGWVDVQSLGHAEARRWLGPLAVRPSLPVYHWHLQAFGLPEGAELILTRAAMPNQMFALGPHLASQAHIELYRAAIERWYELQPVPEQTYPGPSVQSAVQACAQIEAKLPQMRALARQLYETWLSGVRRRGH